MEEEWQRLALARRIYNKQPSFYRDLRLYTTSEAIQKRLTVLKTLVQSLPTEKRVATNERYRKLRCEQEMLGWKRQLYVKERIDLPVFISLVRMTLELTDKERTCSWEDKGSDREDHASHLIYCVHRTKSLEEMQRMIA